MCLDLFIPAGVKMEFQYNAIMTVFVSLFGGTSLSNVRIKAACV